MMHLKFDPEGYYAQKFHLGTTAAETRCEAACGLIPEWLTTFMAFEGKKTLSARDYLDSCYQHGGGWADTRRYMTWKLDEKTGILVWIGEENSCDCLVSFDDEHAKPDADCPECGGTGQPMETYHPYMRAGMAITGIYGGGCHDVIWQYPHAWVAIVHNNSETTGDFEVARMD